MTSTRTTFKTLQHALIAIGLATALVPLHAQTPPSSGSMAKSAASAAPGTMNQGQAAMGAHAMGQGGDMKAMMNDMHSQMTAMKSTGNLDVDFAMMMRTHHQGAITMAEAQLKDGKDPQMKKLAQTIIAAQKKEIAVFDKYLAKHSDVVKK